MTTADAAVQLLAKALATDDGKQRAAAVGKRYELRFVGDGERRFTMDLAAGTPSIVEGASAGACSLGVNADDVEDLLHKRTTLGALFSTGRLRVFGNVGDAMKLEALFT